MAKKVFLFPGQGSQSVGMGKSLAENFTLAKQLFEEASDTLRWSVTKVMFEGPESDLKLTHITQPVILCHSVAAYRVLRAETGVSPDLVAGHSLGEYSALVAAGALSFADAVRLVHQRGRFMQEAVPVGTGSMAALVGCTEQNAQVLCKSASSATGGICEMANFNGGGQIVLSGSKAAIDEAVKLAGDPVYGVSKAVPLPVSAPFHCSLMKKAEDNMRPLLEQTNVDRLAIPYIANIDARIYDESSGIVDRLVRQICGSVRWEQSMQQLTEFGVSEAYEIGPGRVLAGLLRRIQREIKCKAVDTAEDIKNA